MCGRSVVTMYLSVRGNGEMLPAIRRGARSRAELGLGAPMRVVTFSFEVPGLVPAATATVDGIPIYLYRITGEAAAAG